MTKLKTIAAAAIATLTIATAFSTSAEAFGGRRAAFGLGLLGGAVLGAGLAHGAGYYGGPAYGYGGYGGCFRKTVGYTWDGFPIRRTVCY